MPSLDEAEVRARTKAVERERLHDGIADYDRLLTVIAASSQLAQRALAAGDRARVERNLARIDLATKRGAEFSAKLRLVLRPCDQPAENFREPLAGE